MAESSKPCAKCGAEVDENVDILCPKCETLRYCSWSCLEGDETHTKECKGNREKAFQVMNGIKACEGCSTPLMGETIMRCSRCKKVYYCSADCQKEDWPEHKKECAPAGDELERDLAVAKIRELININDGTVTKCENCQCHERVLIIAHEKNVRVCSGYFKANYKKYACHLCGRRSEDKFWFGLLLEDKKLSISVPCCSEKCYQKASVDWLKTKSQLS